jgi:hypothetical protein
LRLGTGVGRRLAPFDVETYVRVHFTKVADQTHAIVARFVEMGREDGRPVDRLLAVQAAAKQLGEGYGLRSADVSGSGAGG